MADDINKLLAELFAQQQQQVPPGNPIAEHYDAAAKEQRQRAGFSGSVGPLIAGYGGLEAMEGNPLALLAMLLGGGVAASAPFDVAGAAKKQGTADMWANRFGANDGQQGLPGTPSGPAVRRK